MWYRRNCANLQRLCPTGVQPSLTEIKTHLSPLCCAGQVVRQHGSFILLKLKLSWRLLFNSYFLDPMNTKNLRRAHWSFKNIWQLWSLFDASFDTRLYDNKTFLHVHSVYRNIYTSFMIKNVWKLCVAILLLLLLPSVTMGLCWIVEMFLHPCQLCQIWF